MGTTDAPRSPQSQALNQVATATSDGSGKATFTFPSPPQGQWWTGTLSCAAANTGGVFQATIGSSGAGQTAGGTSWGSWGGNSVYGPIQCFAQQQLTVTATSLAANTVYQLTWLGTADPADTVAAIWPDSNSTALTAQISGTVPVSGTVSVGNTVSTNSNITGGSVGVSGTVTTGPGSVAAVTGVVAANAGATTTTATGSGSSTSLAVASTATFTSSGFISVPASGGTLVFAYTGTTATSFTGLSLVVGTAAWTIANGAAVVASSNPASTSSVSGTVSVGNTVSTNSNITGGSVGVSGSITTLAGSQTNAAGLDVLVASFGFSALPATSTTVTAGQSYGGFQLNVSIASLTATALAIYNVTQGLYYTVPRPAAGGAGGFSPYAPFYGTSGNAFWIPLQANAGDQLQIIVSGSGSGGTGNIELWGLKYPPVTSVVPSPNQSFNNVQFGGLTNSAGGGLALTSGVQTLIAAPANGLATRLHSITVVGAVSAPTGIIEVLGGSNNRLGVVVLSSANTYSGGTLMLNGLLVGGGLAINLVNRTASATGLSAWANYDTVVIPNIV